MNELTAIILAAGRGMRLQKYTDNKPKPFVEINNKSIIGKGHVKSDSMGLNSVADPVLTDPPRVML